MKHLILIVAALLVMQSLPKALAKGPMGVKIATLNLQWFGLGGEFSGTLSDEYRGPWIKEFISIELRDVDVVVFEEIVDVNAFEDLMQPNFKCVSYHHSSPYHQHVVLCHKSHLEFVKEKDDDNYAFEDSALNPMARPALHGVLKRRNGKALLRIFGVHLKAFPNETKTRLQQLAKIASRIKSLKDGLPVAILGDFNSHIAKVTKLKKDDWEYIDRKSVV